MYFGLIREAVLGFGWSLHGHSSVCLPRGGSWLGPLRPRSNLRVNGAGCTLGPLAAGTTMNMVGATLLCSQSPPLMMPALSIYAAWRLIRGEIPALFNRRYPSYPDPFGRLRSLVGQRRER